jgi:hypothetical protein
MTYAEKLRDPRWQKKRLEILNLDNWTCRICGDTETTLHVHHLLYIRGREPWNYVDEVFMTLCEDCHLAQPKTPSFSEQTIGKYNELATELGGHETYRLFSAVISVTENNKNRPGLLNPNEEAKEE